MKKSSKILMILTMAFTATSFSVYADDGNDAVDKSNPSNPETTVTEKKESTNETYSNPSPSPVKASIDHVAGNPNMAKPVLELYGSYNASPVDFAAAIPSSFRGVNANTIIGAENMNGIYAEIAKGQRTVRILQIGDSHVRGNIYPQTIKKDIEGRLNTDNQAVSFDYIGINGARASKFTSDDLLAKIAAKRPDLVIISFGTNEAHGNFSYDSNTRTYESLVQGIRQRCPNVVFLLTTPPGSYIPKGGTKVMNRTNETVSQNIMNFGLDHHIAVWDCYHIVGGNENACNNWIRANMMQNDRVHLTASGYYAMGHLFSEAFLKGYNKFLRR